MHPTLTISSLIIGGGVLWKANLSQPKPSSSAHAEERGYLLKVYNYDPMERWKEQYIVPYNLFWSFIWLLEQLRVRLRGASVLSWRGTTKRLIFVWREKGRGGAGFRIWPSRGRVISSFLARSLCVKHFRHYSASPTIGRTACPIVLLPAQRPNRSWLRSYLPRTLSVDLELWFASKVQSRSKSASVLKTLCIYFSPTFYAH
jgi:hypothetical protein